MTDKKSNVDQNLIRELAALLDETGLNEIEIEQGNIRVRVARRPAPVAVAPPPPAPPPPAAKPEPPATPAPPADFASHAGAVNSPMVGTAYLSPEPGTRPYVEVGDTVSEGQTVLIVEAMKTMNQIPAPRGGKVERILVQDGQPVEYGEPLMIIE